MAESRPQNVVVSAIVNRQFCHPCNTCYPTMYTHLPTPLLSSDKVETLTGKGGGVCLQLLHGRRGNQRLPLGGDGRLHLRDVVIHQSRQA